MTKVYYYTHPDAVLDDEGVFVLPGGKSDDIPIIEDEPEPEE